MGVSFIYTPPMTGASDRLPEQEPTPPSPPVPPPPPPHQKTAPPREVGDFAVTAQRSGAVEAQSPTGHVPRTTSQPPIPAPTPIPTTTSSTPGQQGLPDTTTVTPPSAPSAPTAPTNLATPTNLGTPLVTDHLSLVLVQDRAERRSEPPPFLWESILPQRGTSLLIAPPKGGKTTFERTLGYSVAKGRPLFGRKTKKSTVVLLLLEENEWETDYLCYLMGTEGFRPDDRPLYVHTGPLSGNLRPPDRKALLIKLVEQYRPGLLVLDTFGQYGTVRDMNDYQETTREMTFLRELALKTTEPCHIMVAHHTNKVAGRENYGPGDAVMGSQGLFGAVDTLIYIQVRGEERFISTVQRYREPLEKIILVLNKQTGMVEGGPTEQAYRKGKTRQKVIEILEKAGTEGEVWAELKKKVAGRHEVLREALDELTREQVLEQIGTGRKGSPNQWRVRSVREEDRTSIIPFPYI